MRRNTMKMKRLHTHEYVIKIAEEMGFTPYDVMRQVMEYTGSIELGLNAFEYLQHFNAKDIRKILTFNILGKEETQWKTLSYPDTK